MPTTVITTTAASWVCSLCWCVRGCIVEVFVTFVFECGALCGGGGGGGDGKYATKTWINNGFMFSALLFG